jgi:predicted P-loop ATPase
MDNLPDLKDKDSMLNLQGKWLIELGELANVKRTDFNLVKAYLVRRTDTVRPHFGRLVNDVPRQSVFIGTVNEGQYLKDPTGNRRYWPVQVGNCDVKGLSSVRDQLFAEAMHVYRSTNEILMLGPVATAQALEAQEDRRIDDEETEMREAMVEFSQTEAGKAFDFQRFRIRDLASGVGAPFGKWASDRYFAQTASQVLRNLGFERRKVGGQRIWGRPKNEVESGDENLGALFNNRGLPGSASAPHEKDEYDFR